jgi:ABC-type antimicrobial peptide transport system permease subunit
MATAKPSGVLAYVVSNEKRFEPAGASRLIAIFADFKPVVSTNSIILAFGVSFAIGVFFGFYPAQKAAALNPIDALRYE